MRSNHFTHMVGLPPQTPQDLLLSLASGALTNSMFRIIVQTVGLLAIFSPTICLAQTDYSALEAACFDDVKLTSCKAMEAASAKCNAIDPNDQDSLVGCVCVQSMFSLYIE